MTDKHEYLRKAHQAANDFKYGYVTISNSALGVLLAERDALAAEAQEQARLLGISAERELRLLAERDALRKALETMVKVGEMNGVGRAYAMKVARAALGQEEV